MQTSRGKQEQVSDHSFVLTEPPAPLDEYSHYHRVIYCTRCGYVAYDFNNTSKNPERQSKIPIFCSPRVTKDKEQSDDW